MVLMEVYGGGGGDVAAAASPSSEERSVYGRRSNKVGRYVVKLRIMKSGSKGGHVDSNNQEEMEGGDGQSLEVGGSACFSSHKDSLELKNINHGHGSEEEGGGGEDGYDEMMNEGERNQSQQQQLITSTSKTKEFICSVCRKKFTSMKSLSGHMRCHPERNWRGIQPPPSAFNDFTSSPTTRITPQRDDDHDDDDGNSSAPSASADDSDHHVCSLSSWPMTAKRSRSTFQLTALEENKEMVSDAAEGLLLLSQGNPLKEWKRKKVSAGVEEEFGGDESGDLLLNNAEEESGVSGNGCSPKSMNKDCRREGEDGLFDLEKQKSDEEEEEEESESKKMIMNFYQQLNYGLSTIKKKKKKMRALKKFHDDSRVDEKQLQGAGAGAGTGAAAARRYHCEVCDKNFASHQALGGHKASHKKGRHESSAGAGDNLDTDGDVIITSLGSDDHHRQHRVKAAASVHRCKICDKSFPSGQALGGHQRCHWSAPVELPAAASSVTSQEEDPSSASKEGGRRVLDFDLNQPPPIDPDHHPLAIALNYASASSFLQNSAATAAARW